MGGGILAVLNLWLSLQTNKYSCKVRMAPLLAIGSCGVYVF